MDLAADLALLEAACRAGGAIARRHFEQGCKSWSKQGGSPVTEADLEVDTHLKSVLTAARPDYGWLSEESADDRTRLVHDTLFIVDPIDGTIAFLKGRPHFTICAAVVRQGMPVAGVVFNPMLDHLYKASSDGGAFRNGDPIHVSTARGLVGCAMLGDRAMLTRPPWPEMKAETRNSVAYRVVLVAEGSFDATVSLSAKRDWDLAAADIILREAGGRVTDRSGAPLFYNRTEARQSSLVAAGPQLHAEILALLA
ncbi:MAG: 3'(2'),5'-bisphosphate nucleotidase CysQ [Alphaproteobacteria bacterium]|nr:3'(2'),5'-bisphosphate nucleotidase CysQ [Alphaproteobacteria bacterium]